MLRQRVATSTGCQYLNSSIMQCFHHLLKLFGSRHRSTTSTSIAAHWHKKVHSGVRQSGNEKSDRGRSNLTWEKSVKRDLNDWCITKELALDRSEWKLAIHVPEPWSSVPFFFIVFCQSFFLFFSPIFTLFLLSVLLSFLLLSNWFLFLLSFVFPLLFWHYFIPISLAHVVSFLAYPNLLETKRLGCW